ncbi:MAG: asparagine synthase (glutamine-hydrolyzing), partial [Owenweeksia sp.]
RSAQVSCKHRVCYQYAIKMPLTASLYEALESMNDAQTHRGPDGHGTMLEPEIGLAHRRLSILDLSEAGRQPMYSSDGQLVIAFNGEIFNFQALREELKGKGYSFHSHTDTEVLLCGYQEYGAEVLHKLNGMFAFAIWDKESKETFIARDRIGVKPLYFSEYNDLLYFASEPKALIRAGVPKDLNEEALEELLLFKYVAGKKTIYKHIQRLLPGHCMTIGPEGINIKRWWDLPAIIKANRSVKTEPKKWFTETFRSSVQLRMISDVPVGILLSGGLDSSSVAVQLNELGHKGNSY